MYECVYSSIVLLCSKANCADNCAVFFVAASVCCRVIQAVELSWELKVKSSN